MTGCVDSILKAQRAILMTSLKLKTTSFRRIFYFCLSILTKNTQNLISAKYLDQYNFITKYLNLNWITVKRFIIYKK